MTKAPQESEKLVEGETDENQLKDNVRKRAFSAAIWKVTERFSAAFITIVVQIVLARLLAPADFGLIAIIVVFTNISQVFVAGGMGPAIVRDDHVSETDCSTVFWASLFIAAVLYTLLFFGASSIESFYGMDGLRDALRVVGLVLFAGAFNSVQTALLQRELKMRSQFIATLIASLISGAVGISMAILGFGVWALVAQIVLQQLFVCFVMYFQIRWLPRPSFSLVSFRRLFGFGWKLMVSSLLHALYMSLYDLIVGKMFSASDLGLFSQGKKYPAQAESILDSAIIQVTLPAAAMVKHNKDSLKSLMRRAIQIACSTIVPFMALLCVSAQSIVVLLLGDQWSGCVPYFQVFCIEAALSPISRINLQCINAVGRSDEYLKLEVVKKIIAISMIAVASLSYNLMLLAFTSLLYGVIALLINLKPSKAMFGYGIGSQILDSVPALVISAVSAGVGMIPGMFVSSALELLVLNTVFFLASYIGISEIARPDSYVYTKSQIMALFRSVRNNAVGKRST